MTRRQRKARKDPMMVVTSCTRARAVYLLRQAARKRAVVLMAGEQIHTFHCLDRSKDRPHRFGGSDRLWRALRGGG